MGTVTVNASPRVRMDRCRQRRLADRARGASGVGAERSASRPAKQGATDRTGTMTIAGQTFTVTQPRPSDRSPSRERPFRTA